MTADHAEAGRSGATPLAGIKVVEFCQMVMGPSCGLILADLGADLVKVEPPGGERTRRLTGIASGFFSNFSRNKRSVAIDTASAEGQAVARRLIGSADVVIENFRPGLMKRFGLDNEAVAAFAPHVVYCSMKGFLPGPYENRTALDEVVQMMGGLAYMTGPVGRPMRAGASVNDIMGGMFAVIAILGALRERERTGRGAYVQSALFENNVFLMGQAMLNEAMTGEPSIPWSVRRAPWPVYDLFETADGSQIFLAVVGDEGWRDFCRAFGFDAWLEDPALADTAGRAAARDRIIPAIAAVLRTRTADALSETFERLGLGFAPVGKPGDLPHDRHLLASGGLVDITLPDGRTAKAPALPVSFDGTRPGKRRDVPAPGEHTREALTEIGLGDAEIEALAKAGAIAGPGLAREG